MTVHKAVLAVVHIYEFYVANGSEEPPRGAENL